MTDLDTLRDMLTRANVPRAESWRDIEEEEGDTAWEERSRSYLDDSDKECVTMLQITGQWTGIAEFQFAADGSIRHIYVAGD